MRLRIYMDVDFDDSLAIGPEQYEKGVAHATARFKAVVNNVIGRPVVQTLAVGFRWLPDGSLPDRSVGEARAAEESDSES